MHSTRCPEIRNTNMDFAYTICVILTTSLLQTCIGQNVAFEMKINPGDSPQRFNLGTNKVLMCTASLAENSQRPVLHWEINDVPITGADTNSRVRVEEGGDGSRMLRVDKVQDGDEGIYKCVATLGSQTDSRSILVHVVQELKVTSSKNQFGIFGQDGTVECTAVAKPVPSITWKFSNNTKIQSGEKYIIQQDQMTIKGLVDADEAQYWCDIVVFDLGSSEIFKIDYQVVRMPKIDMLPTISPNNPKVGDPEVRITCHAEGRPKPTYTFKKGDNIISGQNVDESNGILTIYDLKREDEGVYSCVATNLGGSDEKSTTLDVKIPPVIHDIDDVRGAVEGGQQRVTCMAEGDPAPTVMWSKLGQAAFTNDGTRDSGPTLIDEGGKDEVNAEIKTTGKTMDFTFIKPQDAGTYVCTAINVVGNATKSIKFEVRYKPHFDTDYKITTFFGWRGHTANMTCLCSANEVATFKWLEMKDGRLVQIENEAPYTLAGPQEWPDYYLSSSSLLVFVSDEDSPVFKDYICQATNRLGEANQTVTLKRATAPETPIVRVPSMLPTKVTVEIEKPKVSGGQPVTGYHYEYYPDGNIAAAVGNDIESSQEITTIELKDLTPNTGYLIKVRAKNAVGMGGEIPVSFTTKEVSRPAKPEILSPQEGPDPTSYTVRWAEIDNGGSDLTGIVFSYRRVLVTGTEPATWKIAGDVDKTNPPEVKVADVKALSHTLTGLERDTYYDIRMKAINKQGESPESFLIIKTSPGMARDTGNDCVSVTSSFLLLILACLSALW